MTLGINGWRIHGQLTGVGRYLLNIVRHWSSERTGPFTKITFYTPQPIDRQAIPIPDNIEIRVLASKMRMLEWENFYLGPTAKDDVVFCPSFSRPLLARTRMVVTSHDALTALHPEMFTRSVKLFYDPLYAWSARHATLVVTDSEASRADVVRCWNVDRAKTRVVYLAPAACFFPLTEIPPPERPFFLFVGKMSGRRNVPLLLEAFALFKKKTGFPHQLMLVGLNPHRLDLMGQVEKLGIADSVRYPGYMQDCEVNLLYNQSTALVMPAVYETVSLPIMEAQAARVPVICIDTAGMRETTGGQALLIPKLLPEYLCEAMEKLAGSQEFRDDLAARGHEQSRRFSWERCSVETLDVLAEAAARA